MKGERTVPFARPEIGEEEQGAVEGVLSGSVLAHGPQCSSFEAEFAEFIGDDANCVAVSSCMAALHLSYLSMDIGPGDEVVVPALTHVATAHAVEMVGAKAVFCDCDGETGNIDVDMVGDLLTDKTKAVSLVHYVGIPADIKRLQGLCADRGLRLVEDCAIALGARVDGRHVGMFGDSGCYSFYPAKHITTGEGGMFITKDAELAARARLVRGFGVNRNYAERKIPGHYDVTALGLNYRMSEIQAAIGRMQLKRLDGILKARDENFRNLKECLDSMEGLSVLDLSARGVQASRYCLVAVLDERCAPKRDQLLEALVQRGVGCSIYYPGPVPMMSYYKDKYGYTNGMFPNAERISGSSVALPVGPHMSAEDVLYVADMLKQAVKEVSR